MNPFMEIERSANPPTLQKKKSGETAAYKYSINQLN